MRPSHLLVLVVGICMAADTRPAATRPATPEAEVRAAIMAFEEAKEEYDFALLKSNVVTSDLNLQYWESELGERKARKQFRDAISKKFGREGARYAADINNLHYGDTDIGSLGRMEKAKVTIKGDTAELLEPPMRFDDPPTVHRARKVAGMWKCVDPTQLDAAMKKEFPSQAKRTQRILQMVADVESGKLKTVADARRAWEDFDGVPFPADAIVRVDRPEPPPVKKEPEVAVAMDRLNYESTMLSALPGAQAAMKLTPAQVEKISAAQTRLTTAQKDFRAKNATEVAKMTAVQREIDAAIRAAGGNADPNQLVRRYEPFIGLYRELRNMMATFRTEVETELTPDQRAQWQAVPIRQRVISNLDGVALTEEQKAKLDPAILAAAQKLLAKPERSVADIAKAADDVTNTLFKGIK